MPEQWGIRSSHADGEDLEAGCFCLRRAGESGSEEGWEVARGVLLYGCFYSPLYALSEHQLRRVADAAILHRYQQAGGPPNKKRDPDDGQLRWPDFKRRVEWLIDHSSPIIRERLLGSGAG